MDAPKFLIKPIRFYFIFSVITILSVEVLIDFSFYKEGQKIQENIKAEARNQAKEEIQLALANSYLVLTKQLETIVNWDEVHQQYHDPSYYFFWHDERLKESILFKSYYDNIELYSANKALLRRADTKDISNNTLPTKIITDKATVVFDQDGIAHLLVFQKVNSRSSGEVIGYIGISADLLQVLKEENDFNFTDSDSISIKASNSFNYENIGDYIQYRPIKTPATDLLWQLVQNFIVEAVILMILLSLALAFAFNFMIYKPLEQISTYLKALKTKPNDKHKIPPGQFFLKEFEELKSSPHDYHTELQKAHQKLDRQNRTVWEQARRDGLTNVFNRRAFDEAWAETVHNYEQDAKDITFILFDCDFFKALNDTYGHDVGDEVIVLTASTIQKSLPIDTTTFRIGGDEFAVIVHDCSLDRGIEIAEACTSALYKAPFNSLGIREKLTFSVGISSTDGNSCHDVMQLPRQADMAMYKAKQSLREKIQCYNIHVDSESQSLISNKLVNTVVDSINTGENIELHYQPIKELASGSVYYETLLRIRTDNEKVFPNDIFKIVYRRRLEVELDRQVIQQVQKALNNGVLPPGTGLSINISGKTLLQPFFPDLFKTLKPYLSDYKIVLEITENSLIDHMEYASEVLNNLRQEGFLIALDDFGSGYSSIRYLANMPVDIIKFDMSMTQALIDKDTNTQQIIKTTAQMILSSGYDLVMEGIESEEMLSVAQAAGATHIQGYLIGKPQNKPKKNV